MLIPRSTRIHLATLPVDLRKSIDGLSGAVREVFEDDPASGHLFMRRLAEPHGAQDAG